MVARLTFPALLALAGAPAAAQDTAARLIALTAESTAEAPDRACAKSIALCLTVTGGSSDTPAALQLQTGAGDTARVHSLALPRITGPDDSAPALWDKMIALPAPADSGTEPGPILIGVISAQSTMYSGGGAQARRLHLLRIDRDYGAPRITGEVLDVPLDSNVMIRACFSVADMRQRAGACHDEYRSGATLTLTGAVSDGMPVLGYAMVSESWPGPVSRQEDSLAKRRLRKRDLIWSRDEACSFETTFTFNPTTRRYEASEPGPDCSDYDVP
jgi:hypothetical protein